MDFKKTSHEFTGPKNNPLPNAIAQDELINWTTLHDAAATGDDKKLEVLLTRSPDRAVKESNHGNTPLHEAAVRGFSRCVKILCTPAYNDPKSKDKKQKNSKTTNTKGILASTILDVQNYGGFTALHLAAQNGHNQSCRELLLAGADPDIKNNYGDTSLHTSCRYGHAGATRILISADCDPNKVNLNGDHPLHISCAMGRRKLTRLLLEAECDMNMKNAQGETPRDIAIRKNYSEILEILNNPQRMRNRRGKSKPRNRKGSLPDPKDINGISWSPYGCHYFPDPRSFPAPKLETLPKEPLKKGEQYYLDLAGHIRKGPIGVGNTCYCGPFFKHIEHKINCNRKSLRRYVHKTKESLDNKVQALAMRTNDQIEKLTRSVIADRVRCESRRIQLNRLLKRGDPLRSTTDHQLHSKSGENALEATLPRSRSMEIIDRESAHSSVMSNAKSCGGLLDQGLITIHQANDMGSDSEEEEEEEEEEEDANQRISGSISADSVDCSEDEDQIKEYEIDFYNAAESLSTLLEKAKILSQIKKAPDKSELPASGKILRFLDTVDNSNLASKSTYLREEEEPESEEDADNTVVLAEEGRNRYENIDNVEGTTDKTELDILNGACGEESSTFEDSVLNKTSPLMNEKRDAFSPDLQSGRNRKKFFSSLNRNEYTLQNVISALRKDRRDMTGQRDLSTTNETEITSEDKLSYKDESVLLTGNGFLQIPNLDDRNQTSSALLPIQRLDRVSASQLLRLPENLPHEAQNLPISQIPDPRISGTVEKVEIRNSEIKLLKKPADVESTAKRNRVQELVARLQGKLSATQILNHSRKKKTNERRVSHSESSEDEQNNHNEYKSTVQGLQSPVTANINISSDSIPHIMPAFSSVGVTSADYDASIGIPVHMALNIPERVIPKDAYFHELPNKKRKPINAHITANNHQTSIRNVEYADERLHPMVTPSNNLLQSRYYDSTSNFKNLNDPLDVTLQTQTHNKYLGDRFSSRSVVYATGSNNYSQTNICQALESGASRATYKVSQNLPQQNYVHYVERDISNDSGVSTHFYGGVHGPSPSLSPQTYYPSSERLQSPQSFLYSNELSHIRQHNGSRRHPEDFRTGLGDHGTTDYTIGNVSSLV